MPTATEQERAYLRSALGSSAMPGDTLADLRNKFYTGAASGVVFNPDNFWKWRTALAKMRTGAGDAKILCIGDSTTAGVGSNGSTAQGSPNSYPSQLAKFLNGGGLPAAVGLGIPGPNTNNEDARWTPGASWGRSNSFGFGNNVACWSQNTTATPSNLVYADPNVLADRFDVYYAGGSTTGIASITATGGVTSNVDTSGANGIRKVTVSAAAASTSNTVTITTAANAGNVHIVGIEPWLSTTSKVRVGNAGVGSSRTTGWGAVNSFGSVESIKTYAPNLALISLGLNDANDGTSVSSYLNALQAVINAAAITADVIVMPPIPSTSGVAANIKANSPVYAEAVRNLQGVTVVDTYKRWGSNADTANSLGWYFDSIHPNHLGYADLAQMLATPLLKSI